MIKEVDFNSKIIIINYLYIYKIININLDLKMK